jgi:integrase
MHGCSTFAATTYTKQRTGSFAGLAMVRWTPHDLRRTAATILDRAGYSLEQIGALLAHTREGVTAVYARWDKFDLRREMATVVEQSLRETLDGEPTTAIKAAA